VHRHPHADHRGAWSQELFSIAFCIANHSTK
jgi:hypothetical protein